MRHPLLSLPLLLLLLLLPSSSRGVAPLRISELLASPFRPSDAEKDRGLTDPDLFQFIEITNSRSDVSVSLDGVSLEGDIKFHFPPGVVLPPNPEFKVLFTYFHYIVIFK